MEIHYIELPKFRRELKRGNLDLNDPVSRLTLLLNKNTSSDLIEQVRNMDKSANEIYEKTLHVLKNQKEYLVYIRAEQAELDEKAQLSYATEIGVEKGLKKGEKIGVEKEKIEIAIKLKKLNYPHKEIAEITGIPEKEIKEL